MLHIVLTHPTPDGSEEIAITGDRTSFGRGSESDHYFSDDGLSRLHTTVYREGDNVWIVDENSTNGTTVNGIAAKPGGTPLKNGDSIKIGHQTTFTVRISKGSNSALDGSGINPVEASPGDSAAQSTSYVIPIALIAGAILIIGISGIFIGISVFGNNQQNFERTSKDKTKRIESDSSNDPQAKDKTVNKGDEKPAGANIVSESPGDGREELVNVPKGKPYSQMSETEQRQYIGVRAMKVAQMIGNSSAEAIPGGAITTIKKDMDGYLSRLKLQRSAGVCKMGGNLEQTFERASKYAPYVIRSFYSQGLDPQIGLYLAMIESEHCECLQSPTGPLGMFQFARAAAKENGLNVKDNASPANPDERCEPEAASKAAAKYMKTLSGKFGTGPLSIPLAIASYNSGQGALSNNLEKAMNSGGSQQRSFWTLVSNAENLSKQFKLENIRYVPKFFASAIIGENPQDFGLNLQPLSTYNK